MKPYLTYQHNSSLSVKDFLHSLENKTEKAHSEKISYTFLKKVLSI